MANSPKGKVAALRLHRESDEAGDFFVAFLIPPQSNTDFLTFGSRKPDKAAQMAKKYAADNGIKIAKMFKTDEDDDT